MEYDFIKECLNKGVDKELIEFELYNICDRVHASCDDDCPIYCIYQKEKKELKDCPYFKEGALMLKRIKKYMENNNA